MTFCVAMLCDKSKALILAADKMIGIGWIETEPDITKILDLHKNWKVMFAGDDNLYPLDTSFKALGAVYFVTRRVPKPEGGGSHTYLYVGETGDLSTRFDDHHKQTSFDQHNANCIGIHLDSSQKSRLSKESDLHLGHEWLCND